MGMIIFTIVWYIFFLSNYNGKWYDDNNGWNYLPIIFIIAPVFTIPRLLKTAKVVLLGENFEFDSTARRIYKDGNYTAQFDEVDFVQIRTLKDNESSDQYKLSLVLKSGNKIRIEQFKDYSEACDIADDLADILQLEIIKK